jgi:Histidine kinase-, DNA gyrase B-, and HSP90-like ATPase
LSGNGGHKYTMSVDLSVLEALGINLYSNAAAVLSELVANAYDADATCVTINWRQQHGERVVVSDDGVGMDVEALNKRFLTVGYKKRDEEGDTSDRWKRKFMGRKGIGKLSVFSIADTVTVYSTQGGESNGLRIVVNDLKKAINANREYHPDPVDVPAEYRKQGTVLVLEDLKTKRAGLTASALRKRLARRFDVLYQPPRDEGGFYIEINGKRVTFADRQELKHVEFVWEFREKKLPDEALPKVKERFVLPNKSVMPGKDWRVRGWFGTVGVPSQLTTDDEAGSLKNIMVIARGRPIQEGIVEKLDFSRLFGNYVTGQIEADFLDLQGYDDIATSDRQRLIEDDDRVTALRDFLRAAFVKAADDWSKVRPKKEAEDVLKRYPKLREWVDGRPGWQKPAAEQMIGTIAGLEIEGDNEPKDKADLFRAGVLAFERVGLRQAATDLEKLSSVTAENLLPLLGQQGTYEAGLWVDILRSRVEAIDKLASLTDKDELEKVLQEHLFDNLWLLDPSWERAAGDAWIEENLRKIAPGLFPNDPQGSTIEGRMDIRYRTTSGVHVIVELKKYSAKLSVEKLEQQGLKYRTALMSILEQQQQKDTGIVVVFVLGSSPRVANRGRFATDEEFIENRFESLPGRYRLYDALIGQAKHQYKEYLDASDKAKALDALLGTWGTEFATEDDATEDTPVDQAA